MPVMIIRLLVSIACLSATGAYSQTEVALDTFPACVIPLSKTGGDMAMHGFTRDLALLDFYSYSIAPGHSFSLPADSADHLLIVREGSIEVLDKKLGPGGVALLAAGDNPLVHQLGATKTGFYLFSLRSRSRDDPKHVKVTHFALLTDWPEMAMKKTEKGESRQIFSCPVTTLAKIDMHATTLNAGEISHPQHVHRNEEIILMRSGHVRMHIADGYREAKAGDIIYLPSGVPHNLENGKEGPCEYFALQWEP